LSSIMPLLVTQADEAFGSASVVSIEPDDGTSVRVVTRTMSRRNIATHLEAAVYADDGTVVATGCRTFSPTTADGYSAHTFTLDGRRLLQHPRAGAWLRMAMPADVQWSFRLRDDHDHTLDEHALEHAYEWRAA
jgi:hypothetical protein